MAKARVWTSFPGILGLLFMAAAVVGGIFEGIYFWLPLYQSSGGEVIGLVMTILVFAGAGFAGISIIISIFGIPKALWIVFAFLAFGCILAPVIFIVIIQFGLLLGLKIFIYIDLGWYVYNPYDFIGFWLGAGGSLLAFLIGFFIPKDY